MSNWVLNTPLYHHAKNLKEKLFFVDLLLILLLVDFVRNSEVKELLAFYKYQ